MTTQRACWDVKQEDSMDGPFPSAQEFFSYICGLFDNEIKHDF